MREWAARIRKRWIKWREGESEAIWYGLAREFALSPHGGTSRFAYWDEARRRWNVSDEDRERIRVGVVRMAEVARDFGLTAGEATERLRAFEAAMRGREEPTPTEGE